MFGRIEVELKQTRRYFRKLAPQSQLFTGTAKHYTRIIGEVFRERDDEVIGFPHEGGLSGLYLPSVAFTEFATCDRFACLAPEDAESYSAYPNINRIGYFVIGDDASAPVPGISSSFCKGDRIDLKEIETIMYVCYGQHFDIYGSATRSDLQGLYLHLNVLQFLLTLNKRIIFKNPIKSEILSKRHNHFNYFGDKVIYCSEPFTQVLEKADLFVLEGVGSTVLHEAMTLTEKPIVLLKPPIPRCDVHLMRKLEGRCFVVDLFEDEHNRLCFRTEDFVKILRHEDEHHLHV